MDNKLADMRNLRFMLYEVLNVEQLSKYPVYEDHSKETFEMFLETGYKLAKEVFWPHYQSLDVQGGANFDGKKTTVPEGMHEIWNQCKEGGWVAPWVDYDKCGQQFPYSVDLAAAFLFNAANAAAQMYISTAAGAAELIDKFASQQLKDQYINKLYSGQWGGTMALTEPEAGSCLSDITTTAIKSSDGEHYMIKGVKRFISCADHDLTENIIHPVLAKVSGAPAGVKGISLFIIPKYRLNPDGTPGEFNDVITTGIEHKLGLKVNATATLNLGDNDDCHGYLIGQEHKGLAYMFTLMNASRITTGLQAVSGASSAYHCAVQYANQRIQGRDLANKDPKTDPIPIVGHPDVRLMLLKQKAFIEGALGLLFAAAWCEDMMRVADNDQDRQHYNLLLEVLTPCVKAHGSDGAFESISLALQCFGGAGYCEEYPVAQMLRDNRVFSIYEGTNGIQAIDLLGRKVTMQKGAAFNAVIKEIDSTLTDATGIDSIKDIAEKLKELQDAVKSTTKHLAAIAAKGNIHLYMCNASTYLEMFSQMLLVWQLLRQAIVAQKALDAGTDEQDFYNAKIETARFYTNRTVPRAIASAQIITSDEHGALDYKSEWF